jgi:phosphoribosyl 1,2-cyclic phosphodiesterase
MPIRFTVLASGSAGNASLVQVEGFGLLLDAGLGPRQLSARLSAAGASWSAIDAVLLTHTHSDHWNDRTLAHLRRRGVPLWCHAEHGDAMRRYGTEFEGLHADGLVRCYEAEQEWLLAPNLRCRTLPLSHDGGPTFGFRFEAEAAELFGQRSALAYAADLGTWTPALAQALADVDVLALEFNHDVAMQHASGRSFQLIRRVLGDRGHLSNVQAATLVQEMLRLSAPGRLRHLVQLHLSRECNRPELAAAAARTVLSETTVGIHTAEQDVPGPDLAMGDGQARKPRPRMQANHPRKLKGVRGNGTQCWLPGMEPVEMPASGTES